jgi:threonine/homoserine efflux transporter RhtA
MAGATLLLGILLLIKIILTPQDKPIFGRFVTIATAILFALFSAYAVWLGTKVPGAAENLIGQAVGLILILLVFVAIGIAVRKWKYRKAGKH